MLQKLKSIKLGKRLWYSMIAVEIMLSCAFCFIQSKQEPITLEFAEEDLTYDTGESGSYLDTSYGGKYIVTPKFTLPKGLYTVEIQSEYARLERTIMEIHYADGRYDYDLIGRVYVANAFGTPVDLKVKYTDRPMGMRIRMLDFAEGDDYILIRNIKIVTAKPSFIARYYLLRFAVFFLAIDLLIFIYNMQGKLSDESKNHMKVLLLLIFVSSIPLMVNYLFRAHDINFHLMRIEGLKEGLLYGMFPVKIQPGWLNGHGYAVSVFYGDIFLYIPAVLRIFGVSVQTSYQSYVFLVNTATVLIAYYCFRGMSNAKVGLVCTVVYTLNIYRLVCIYTRAAVGEYTAMVFMPLVLFGLWKIYTLPEESKEHQKSWITVAVGCTGIFLSHMITTEITALFIIIAATVLWKKTFRKKTFLVLCKAAIVTVLLTCWFLVPFLDYMTSGTYSINDPNSYAEYLIENRGILFAQFFMSDYAAAGASDDIAGGVASEMPLTLGLSAPLIFVSCFFQCHGKKERDESEKKTKYFIMFLCALSFWLTLDLFPYTWLVHKVPILKMFVRSIQFPWRFLTMAAMLSTYLLLQILKTDWRVSIKKKLFVGILIGLSLCQGVSYTTKCLRSNQPYNIYQAGTLSTFSHDNGEYLPLNSEIRVDVGRLFDRLYFDDSTVFVQEWKREKSAIIVSLINSGNEIAQVEVPFLLYKGYHAITDSGEELLISPGESYRISVSVPANYSGTIRVGFNEPWYWRICEMISLVTLLCLIFYSFIRKNSHKQLE